MLWSPIINCSLNITLKNLLNRHRLKLRRRSGNTRVYASLKRPAPVPSARFSMNVHSDTGTTPTHGTLSMHRRGFPVCSMHVYFCCIFVMIFTVVKKLGCPHATSKVKKTSSTASTIADEPVQDTPPASSMASTPSPDAPKDKSVGHEIRWKFVSCICLIHLLFVSMVSTYRLLYPPNHPKHPTIHPGEGHESEGPHH